MNMKPIWAVGSSQHQYCWIRANERHSHSGEIALSVARRDALPSFLSVYQGRLAQPSIAKELTTKFEGMGYKSAIRFFHKRELVRWQKSLDAEVGDAGNRSDMAELLIEKRISIDLARSVFIEQKSSEEDQRRFGSPRLRYNLRGLQRLAARWSSSKSDVAAAGQPDLAGGAVVTLESIRNLALFWCVSGEVGTEVYPDLFCTPEFKEHYERNGWTGLHFFVAGEAV